MISIARIIEGVIGGALVALAGACGFQVSGVEDPAADAAAADSPVFTGSWWDPAYEFRRAIVVTTSKPVTEHHSVSFAADTAALVTAGVVRADARDWRIVRRDGDQWREIDRWVDDIEGGGWNAVTSRTWFRIPLAIAAGATDDQTYVYYGNAAVTDTARTDLDQVFLFGDDFEHGLDRWTTNNRGEVATIATLAKGGTGALQLATDGTSVAGIHHDLTLPAMPLLFSSYLRQDQTTASFGYMRGFSSPHADRAPGWLDALLRLACELDSADRLQILADGGTQTWLSGVGTTQWRHIETALDTVADTILTRADGGAWLGPYPNRYIQHTAIRSIALEGEGGENGTFRIDNYVIRGFVDPEPVASMQEQEQR